jgi:transcriptional regulator with XRE-family HTH domain
VPRSDARVLPAAFGRAIRELRTGGGLSQEALAERAGLHRTYIGGIERGERNVSLVNIGLLADALDVSLAALMSAVERELRTT